jgi:hypothetical protein
MAGDLMALAEGFQPIEDFTNYGERYSEQEAAQIALTSGRLPVENIPDGTEQPQELAPRLSADRLHRMYEAWEHAKDDEIHEQWKASRYYHSRQWTDAEIRELNRRGQPVTTKNRIKRKVDFLVGIEQRLRRDPKAYPRNPNGDKAAQVATAALRHVEDNTNWDAIASAATRDAMIRGIGVAWCGVKVVKGQAEIRKHWVPADRFFYDPRSEQFDFSDARYLGEWQWLDIDEAVELLPFAADKIEELASSGQQEGALSTLPQEFDKDKNWHTWIDYKQRRIRLVLIWYKHRGLWMFDYLVGPISLCDENYDCKSPYIGEDAPTDHPYRAWSPYIDERGDRYGVVRDMISIQDEINKRTSKMLYMLSVRQTMGEKGAVDDVDRMKRESARPDGHIEFNPGKAFQFVDQSANTQGQYELLQEAKQEIENLGPNPGLIGRGVEQQSGRAILAQQNSGMTELSPVFENMREWKLETYRKDWILIRQFWNGERYIRITSDPQSIQWLNINTIQQDPQTGQMVVENQIAEMDVDIILDEGPDTVTMREELVQQLSQLGPEAVPVELMIELSNLPEKEMILRRLQEAKTPPAEVQQLQERMAQLEQAAKAAEVDKTIAETEETRADAVQARADALKTLNEAGLSRMDGSQPFPGEDDPMSFVNRLQQAATELDEAMQAQNASRGPQQGQGMQQGPEARNGGNMPQRPPEAFEGGIPQEPQFNQEGGLPVGQDVMP